MYSATGERSNVIQSHTLKTNAITFQKSQPTDKVFNYRDILKESQEIGDHLKKNVKYLCHIKGVSITHVFRQAHVNYGFNLKPATLYNLGRSGFKFSSSYIRLVEIALQLIIGYNFAPFDLVLKEYYTERDSIPEILPFSERDTFSQKYLNV
jgi:hypothetical protein